MENIDNFDLSPEALEGALTDLDVENLEDFSNTTDYEKCVVLNKKELANFCRLVEPLTKASIDDYGKSVFFTCIDNDTVEVRYYNNPYVVTSLISNKSGKQVKDFAILVSTLKKLLVNTFASLILVENEEGMNLAFGDQLVYLETKPLRAESYNFTRRPAENIIDKELAAYTFKKVGTILSQTERASEKVVLINEGKALFNTGVFASSTTSPFSNTEDSMVVYKQVADVLSVLSEISKAQLKYSFTDSILTVDCDGTIYCELPAGNAEKVREFISPSTALALQFNSDIEVLNDSLLRLVALVQSLDYLSDIVKLTFNKENMIFELSTNNHSKAFQYKFAITAGAPEFSGDMSLTVGVLKIFLNITGADVKYSFTEQGLGIETSKGKFLLRRA